MVHIFSKCYPSYVSVCYERFSIALILDSFFQLSHSQLSTNSEFTSGWDGYESVNSDLDKLYLEGVQKDFVCDWCTDDLYCESNSCDTDRRMCLEASGLRPTFCPDGERSPCDDVNDDGCESGNCGVECRDTEENVCLVASYKKPTICPDGSTNAGWRTHCDDGDGDGEGDGDECESGNCDWSVIRQRYFCYE